eukprot:TRINITY_DN16521_c0_g1_i3.p1 TRINITY_DN16521_c0_g1~~TRINITY_DN16521_c0_g1_i3.p1  ORF type:complete len:334 (+),score=85.28 TRINITY_DN16521_c0_g1_i3:175-1176(+)
MASMVHQGGVLGIFILLRSAQSLLTRAARGDSSDGFAFLTETMLFFPFIAQSGFYLLQLRTEVGSTEKFTRTLRSSLGELQPCVVYSVLIAVTNLLQTQCLAYLDASTFVVLNQGAIVFVAVFDALLFGNYPTISLTAVTLAQGLAVCLFNWLGQLESADEKKQEPNEAFMFGVILCVISVIMSALGSSLQQRFMQRQALSVPLAAKLFFQHIFGFAVMLSVLLCKTDARTRLIANGFFGGWNRWTYVTSACMWLYFWSASKVTSEISAMAGAMGAAVAIVFTGVGECLFFGTSLSFPQQVVMVAICANALLFTIVKRKAKEAADEAKAAKNK